MPLLRSHRVSRAGFEPSPWADVATQRPVQQEQDLLRTVKTCLPVGLVGDSIGLSATKGKITRAAIAREVQRELPEEAHPEALLMG